MEDLEDRTYSTWNSLQLQCGEQLLLTTGIDEKYPTGTQCVVKGFIPVRVEEVRRHTLNAFKVFMADAGTRPLAWTRVHLSFGGGGAIVPESASVEHIVTRVLNHFLTVHADEGWVLLPYCRLRMVSGNSGGKLVYPSVETVLDMRDALVACRVQMPFAPSAVRTANAMLSATISKQRVVVHCTRVGDVAQARDAHVAPLYVALTRVPTIASVAFSLQTDLHDNIVQERAPFRELAAQVQGWAGDHGYCRLYHCQSRGYDGQEPTPQGSAEHDLVHTQQKLYHFFDEPR